jgi:hypothetical protein
MKNTIPNGAEMEELFPTFALERDFRLVNDLG